MSRPDDERDDASGSAIPGAWARPASAFADESSVVRPDRAGAQGSRVASLAVLGVMAVGTAAFAWGVTVALQALDDERSDAAPQVATKDDDAPAARTPTPAGDERAAKTDDAAEAEAEAATVAGALAVPPGDPSFPALPDPSADEERAPTEAPTTGEAASEEEPSDPAVDDDVPAPKPLRLARAVAEGDDDEPTKRKRYKRGRKGQKLSAAARRRAKARGAETPSDDDAPSTAAAAPAPAPAPTAASLTREAEQLFSQGKLGEARSVAERALGLSRGYPRAHRALAVICAKQGDTACARKGYEAYLKLAPSAPDAPDVRRILGM